MARKKIESNGVACPICGQLVGTDSGGYLNMHKGDAGKMMSDGSMIIDECSGSRRTLAHCAARQRNAEVSAKFLGPYKGKK